MARWLLLLALATTGAIPARALVGPSDDGASFAPEVVMVLQRAGHSAGFCSGVVVARDVVLTAAHCVPPGADLRIHFRDPDGNLVLLPVAAVVRHPGYRANAVGARQRSIDLALVRLNAPLPDRFKPAAIATGTAAAPVGTPFRIVGFGVTRENEGASSGRLRTQMLALRGPQSRVLLWAADPAGRGMGACEGDSGGPVLDPRSDSVAALTIWSAGKATARCGALTQALWLAPVKPWIEDGLGAWEPKP